MRNRLRSGAAGFSFQTWNDTAKISNLLLHFTDTMFKIFPEIFFRRSCSETGLFLQTGFLWLQETGVRLLRISRRKTTGRIEIIMKKKTEKRIRCGRLAGALFVLGVLANGMSMLQIPWYVQNITKGCIILAAVFFDVMRKEKGKKA